MGHWEHGTGPARYGVSPAMFPLRENWANYDKTPLKHTTLFYIWSHVCVCVGGGGGDFIPLTYK